MPPNDFACGEKDPKILFSPRRNGPNFVFSASTKTELLLFFPFAAQKQIDPQNQMCEKHAKKTRASSGGYARRNSDGKSALGHPRATCNHNPDDEAVLPHFTDFNSKYDSSS